MKLYLFKGLFLFLFLLPARMGFARINLLEPWSPSMDLVIPKYTWNHGVNLRLGVDGQGTDLFDLAYFLSTPVSPEWEVGGSLSYMSLEHSGGLSDDSGLSDLSVGAKYRFPKGSVHNSLDLVGEMGISLPTGNPDRGIGAGGFGLWGGFSSAFPIQSITGYAQLGVKLFTEGSDTRFGNVVSYVLGGEHQIDSELLVSLDIRGSIHGRDKINGVNLPDKVIELYLSPGAIWSPSKMPVNFLGSFLIGLTGDSFDLGLLGGIKF